MERLVFLLLFFISTLNLLAFDGESFLRRIVSRAVSEPSLFLREVKSDAEITLPIRSGYEWSFNYSIFPSFFPFVVLSPSLSRRISLESSLPQIDFTLGAQYFAAGDTFARVSDELKRISFYGYHLGLLSSRSLSSRVRNFYGMKYSFFSSGLKLSSDKKHELLGVEIDSFRFSDKAWYILFGVETRLDINNYFALQINYAPGINHIVMKTSWYGKWFELGFNFYPDGVLEVHPIWNMRLNF